MSTLSRRTVRLFAVTLATLGLPPMASSQPAQGEAVVAWHVTLAPSWFDPSTAPPQITAFGMLYAIHDALLRPLPGQEIGNSLAETWTESADGRVYEFRLRRGLKFHNGDPVTAEDVKFSFERYKGAGATAFQERVQKVEVVDSLTVRFQLTEAWPDFLTFYGTSATAAGIVVPKKYLMQVGDDGFKKHPIGAGPYKFVSHTPGVEVVLEANLVLAACARRQAAHDEERAGREHARGDAQERRDRHRCCSGSRGCGERAKGSAPAARGHAACVDRLDRVRRPVGPQVAMARQAPAARGQPRAGSQGDQRERLPRLLSADRGDHTSRHGLRLGRRAAPLRSAQGQAVTRRSRLCEWPRRRRFRAYSPVLAVVGERGELPERRRDPGANAVDRACGLQRRLAREETARAVHGRVRQLGRRSKPRCRVHLLQGELCLRGYPDIDDLFHQQARERDPRKREALLHRIQQLTIDRVMCAPIMDLRALMGFGPRVANHAINSVPMVLFPSWEDMRLKSP